MSNLLVNPHDLEDTGKYAGLVYGQPGVGKTTLLLSSPNPVLIDADRGLRRVEKRFQVPSLPLKSYKDFLDLLEGKELDPFESICIDTMGRFIERMGDYLMDINPKYRQADGSLTLKAYGAIRIEFQRVLRKVKDKDQYLFFGAHEKEEKENDGRYMRPDSPGSAGKDLIKDLDFLGYMEMNGNKRTISFSPTDRYYAKNSLKLDSVMEVPDTTEYGNHFLQKFIIDRAAVVRAADAVENKKYEDLVAAGGDVIKSTATGKELDAALKTIIEMPVIWDSTRQLKKKLNDHAILLGFAYDRETKLFKKAEPATGTPSPAAETAKTVPPEPAPKPKATRTHSHEVLAAALINGINECKTVAEIDSYLKKQNADVVEIEGSAPLSTRAKIAETITAKKQELTDAVHKAA